MLVEVTSREQLANAVKETRLAGVDAIYFPFSIKTQLEHGFPESPIRVFYYPSHGPRKYWFMVKDNVFIKPTCAIAHVPDTILDKLEFIDCLREFRIRAFGALNSKRAHLMIGKEELTKLYSSLMRNIPCDFSVNNLMLSLFYMDEKKKRAMLEHTPALPPNYQLGELDVTEDATTVNGTWIHAKEGDLEQTMAKLMRLPSVCVRHQGKPVAFEMVDPAGYFNNQFVFEPHRRKGLGNAIEAALAKKCIRMGMTPFKTVAQSNKIVLEASKQSPFWNQWKEDGKDVTMMFQEWASEEQTPAISTTTSKK